MHGRRIALLAALTLGLGGCLVSQTPIIAPSEAAFPIPDRVDAEHFKPGDNGWEYDFDQTAYRAGSSYIVTYSEADSEVTLERIAQDTFIAQSKGKEGGYMYGLLVFQGKTIYEYDVDCDDFDTAEKQRYGLIDDGADCKVTSAQGLAAGYLAYLRTGKKPAAAYVLR